MAVSDYRISICRRVGILADMDSTPNANGNASSAKCGPALMISMVLVVVLAVAALIFFQNSKKVVAQPAARPITTTTPKN